MDNYGCRLFVWISKICITKNFSDTDGKRSPHANTKHVNDVVYDHGGAGGVGSSAGLSGNRRAVSLSQKDRGTVTVSVVMFITSVST